MTKSDGLSIRRMPQYPPKLRVTDPATAFIGIEGRFMAWSEIRRIVEYAGCQCTETRVSLLKKYFRVTGDEAALQKFIDVAWYSDTLGPELQKQVGTHIKESDRG